MKKAALTLSVLVALVGCTIRQMPAEAPPPAPAPVAAAPAPAPAPAPAAPAAAPAPPAAGGGGMSAGVGASVPGASAGAAVAISWGNWTSSGGEKPNTACKKESNKELCYDAVDNNCDGHIDEGCPYGAPGTPMQFMIAWKIAVDLDLHVMGPDGKEISFHAKDQGALVLDKDCHANDCPAGKVENVFLPIGRAAMKGHYKVWVEVADPGAGQPPQVPFFFGGKVGAQTFFVPFFMPNKKGEKKPFEFDVI
jgi:tRNA (guanosine-2'-O-)-methyltransferase